MNKKYVILMVCLCSTLGASTNLDIVVGPRLLGAYTLSGHFSMFLVQLSSPLTKETMSNIESGLIPDMFITDQEYKPNITGILYLSSDCEVEGEEACYEYEIYLDDGRPNKGDSISLNPDTKKPIIDSFGKEVESAVTQEVDFMFIETPALPKEIVEEEYLPIPSATPPFHIHCSCYGDDLGFIESDELQIIVEGLIPANRTFSEEKLNEKLEELLNVSNSSFSIQVIDLQGRKINSTDFSVLKNGRYFVKIIHPLFERVTFLLKK